MTVKRTSLKPVRGWVVVGPNGRFPDFDDIRYTKEAAWNAYEVWGAMGGETRADLRRMGYRAVPVVVMERGKK